ncbi:1-deoxy-D-xylulose-5-phosphate synthase [Peptoclostridium litorale DSM 5388]|uniref:1-deoxy-D-xylulose-5-phosphate synthase n=1 Tax=Peptoclostridium litorale DSM 5388 TaxID=1121324 RepID=A0A069RAQ1_PEPLI|nr:1-deoxy-D-xylulose-5-phosphate synthase [Peptoclostridium litorale]KDR94114.1 1-deoxy-D-xylulose-5-phosphate synthase Dxs [Peptoclostridium litorale DSM 5388]SIN81048.1 1-deoxy-D-xylulose-5-phosphate synthase [Peptoclostridium litorale DSM 5388]
MYKHLDNIEAPSDLKKMNMQELKELSSEIRDFLIDKVSKTGGHLASNLGIVEVTLALHCVFDSPRDKFIWDVGHQAYVHKMVTGRKDKFDGLRQYGGLSGFPKRCESKHDVFEVGHSSTSISAGLGMAAARDILNENYNIVSIIGDGALTGGMALEALNHLGHSRTKMIIILNDNGMSISPNVGSISNYLHKMRTNKMYKTFKGEVEGIISSIPKIGNRVCKTAHKVKESVKYFMIPGAFFEELGIKYFGPVDGHDIENLINTLNDVKHVEGPVIIHALTKKGKGYEKAEQYPDKYHGVGSFDVRKGLVSGNKTTYSSVAGDKLVQMAKNDKRIVAVTAAMPDGTGLAKFKREFPDRFFDVGIAEGHAVTFCAGLAANGIRPFFPVYSTFLQRGFDQIIHDVAMQKLPVTLLLDRAGLVGNDGETHHGVFDLSYLGLIPDITVMAPMDGEELEQMLEYSLDINGPVAIRYPRGAAYSSDFSKTDVNSGKWDVLKKGREVAVLAIGKGVELSAGAVEILSNAGISAGLINARFLSPVDEDAVREVLAGYDYVFTVEDNVYAGGFGSSVKLFEDADSYRGRVYNIALPDHFIEHGDTSILLEKYGLSSEKIASRILNVVSKAKKGVV